MKRFFKRLMICMFAFFSLNIGVWAQQNTAICTMILESAFNMLIENCSDLAPNQICFGDDFSSTTDGSSSSLRTDLDMIPGVSTTPINLNESRVGVAIAHLPTNNNQDVYLLSFGDTTIENRGQEPSTRWQDLYFDTTPSAIGCNNMESAIAIYVPGETRFTVRINNAVLQIQGLVSMKWLNANSLSATLHQGTLDIINTGVLSPGQTVSAITNQGEIIAWSAPRPMDGGESLIQALISNAIQKLTNAPLDNVDSAPESVESASLSVDVSIQPQTPVECENSPTYTTKQGDTVYQIALRYGVTIESIVSANQIADASQILVGIQLVIPCGQDSGPVTTTADTPVPTGQCGEGTIHRVEAGQSVYQIARGYGTTVDAIADANGIGEPSLVHIGDELIIPCGSNPPAPAQGNAPVQPPTQPNQLAADFCSSFFNLAPPGGYPQNMIDIFNATCT